MLRIHNILICLLHTAMLCAAGFFSVAQDKYGYEWAAGSYPVIAKAYTPDFANTPIPRSNINVLFMTSACIADTSGTLQFYTNGARVFTRDGLVMKNGDSLTFNSMWHVIEQSGMASEQGAIILPSLYNKDRYIIFHHSSIDTGVVVTNTYVYAATKILYSYVDMTGDSGRGEVISKNEVLLDNVLLDRSRMTACKHANGRDWWIVKNSFIENKYYKFLYTSSQGILGPFVQQIGPEFKDNNATSHVNSVGRAVFSEDGTKYATISGRGPIVVMDFDRCSGEFSNPVEIPNLYADLNISGGAAVAFSPNGRFLYVNNLLELNQYDLWKQDIDSVRLYTRSGFPHDSIDPGNWMIRTSQLAPNGKIYLSTYNGGISAFHVIHQPDSFGLACNFVPFGQQVNTISTTSLPNMPNYRLGKLAGSLCDTIVSGMEELKINNTVKIYPNPASNFAVVSLKEYAPDIMLTVLDVTGKKIHSQPMYLEAGIDISSWSAGVYFVRVESKEKLIGVSKLMKE